MSRDQQIDHGFGICVKGGKDSGEFNVRAQSYATKTINRTIELSLESSPFLLLSSFYAYCFSNVS